MTISSKDTLESAAPPAKSPAPSSAAPAKPDMSRLRADAVSLDVPVKVHGSRVTEVVMGVTPHTEPFEEETSTMIVFPHGGVIRMATTVSVGQMLVVTNQKTKQDAICRVVKVRAYSNTQAYVEVEFTHRQSGYWGVHFSSEDEEFAPGPPPVAARPEPPAVEVRKPDPAIVSSVSVKVEDIPPRPVFQARPESAFVSIGSQEDIQVSASTTSSAAASPAAPPAVPAASPLNVSRESIAPPPPPAPVIPVPVSHPAPPPAPLEEVAAEAPRPARAFGTLTGGAVASPSPSFSTSSSDLGTRLGRSMSESAPQSTSSSSKGMLVAACAAFLIVGVALSAWYFRQHPSGSQTSQQQPAVAPASVSSNSAPSSFPETQNLPPANSPPASSTSELPSQSRSFAGSANASRSVSTRKPADDLPSESGPHVVGEEVGPAPAQKPAMGNIGLAVIGAHPVTTQKSAGNVAAPDITTPAMVSGSALPGSMTSGSPNLAPPPPPPQPLLRVGGNLVPAKVLRSTPPIYPNAARQSGIEGDVVVRADIDETGKVTGAQVISGLAVLRQSAVDAVRGWKYQPATLNGQTVASQVNVTLQFRK
jgi:TonB family protein